MKINWGTYIVIAFAFIHKLYYVFCFESTIR